MWLEALRAKYDGVGTFGVEKWDQLLGHCMVWQHDLQTNELLY